MSRRPKLPPFRRYVPRLSGPSEHEVALRKVLAELPQVAGFESPGPEVLAEIGRLEDAGDLKADARGVLVCNSDTAEWLVRSLPYTRDPSMRS